MDETYKFTLKDATKESAVEEGYSSGIDRDIGKLQQESEASYNEIAHLIVNISNKQLIKQNNDKNGIRRFFMPFFSTFISLQFITLIVMLFMRGFGKLYIPDSLFTAYIVSVFVETLGVIAVMVRFAFDTKQEVEILSTLNGIIEHFQKFKR